jgi:hypothetical protein
MENKPKKHHYVPQSILKKFSINDEEKQIFIYDKQETKSYLSSIKNAGSENEFYSIPINDNKIILESIFSRNDDNVAHIINKIIKSESLEVLTANDRYDLAAITATQYLRTKMRRTSLIDLTEKLPLILEKNGISPDYIKNLKKITLEESKFISIILLAEIEPYIQALINKSLLLLKSPSENPFFISDNPIVFHNSFPYGEIGMDVRGIEIYFPITKTLSVAFYCKSIGLKLKRILQNKDNLPNINYKLLENIFNGIENLNAIEPSKDHIDFMNSLQVTSSSRFIYSNKNNFSLVKDILKINPECKNIISQQQIGEMGKPPPPKSTFPIGDFLVVYGHRDHYMIPITNWRSNEGNIQFFTLELNVIKLILQDLPLEKVSIFSDRQEVIMMRNVKFDKIDFTGNNPIIISHRDKILKHILQNNKKRNLI